MAKAAVRKSFAWHPPDIQPHPPQRHIRGTGKNLFDLPDPSGPCELKAEGRKKMSVLLSVTCSTFYLSEVCAGTCVCMSWHSQWISEHMSSERCGFWLCLPVLGAAEWTCSPFSLLDVRQVLIFSWGAQHSATLLSQPDNFQFNFSANTQLKLFSSLTTKHAGIRRPKASGNLWAPGCDG